MPPKPWSREDVIEAIQGFYEVHGRPPTALEWESSDRGWGYPHRRACVGKNGQPFRTFPEAVLAAGYVPYTSGHKLTNDQRFEDKVRLLRKMLQENKIDDAIAHLMGLPVETIKAIK